MLSSFIQKTASKEKHTIPTKEIERSLDYKKIVPTNLGSEDVRGVG